MVSMMDSSKFEHLMHPIKKINNKNASMSLNKYYREREESAIKVAEEGGYFLDPSEEHLISKFATAYDSYDDIDNPILRKKSGPDLRHIEWVNLHSTHMRHLGSIPLCLNMCICILSDNYICDIEPLRRCTNLVKLDVHNNQISSLPGADFWSALPYLQLLYLHNNPIGKFSIVGHLQVCPRLMALTLFDTPVSLRTNYRHHVVNSIHSLKALDHYMISDEEIIEDSKFTGQFAAFQPLLQIQLVATKQDLDYETELYMTLNLLNKINKKQANTSPVIIIQKFVRGWLTREALKSRGLYQRISHKATPVIPSPASSPFLTYTDALKTHPLPSSSNRPQLVINLAKLQHDTLTNLDNDAENLKKFMQESTSRRLKKIPSISTKKRKKERKIKKLVIMDVKDFFGPVVPIKPSLDGLLDNDLVPLAKYRLQGKRHELCDYDRTVEMIYTVQDVAKDIRMEEAFFHEIRATAPHPPRQFHKHVSISDKMFARSQRSMNLGPLWAVQKAYDDRMNAQKVSDRIDRCNLLRARRDYGLDKVNKIREEQRQNIVTEKQRYQWNLQDALDRNSYRNNECLQSKHQSRCQSSKMLKEHKDEHEFGKLFTSQHAAVSNALHQHDFLSHMDQHSVDQFNDTQDYRIAESDKHEMVKKYIEHRIRLLQSESSCQNQNLNSRLLEDANDRIMKAKMRVEQLKNKKKTIEDYHLSKTVSLHLQSGLLPSLPRKGQMGQASKSTV